MQLESAYGIELDSFTDLVRLVSSASPDRPSTIFKWSSEDNSQIFYGSFAIFPGYYDFKALPVLFFVVHDSSIEEKDQSLVRYDLQAEENQISFLTHIKDSHLENLHTGLIRFIPIVNLKRAPKIFSDLS
ncbi:MAG: hypothetical protein JSV04_00045 [Candidatus Heimdallarchaeota archaeon]|nr:MAG: hypothetical protein JSV04_00045 [Candidatus Heimdallarchaeota archaeon]